MAAVCYAAYMIYDFHTHTFLSDGALSPLELIRRAVVAGYRAIGITDHAGPGELERFIAEVSRDCALAQRYWDIAAIPGVELTHLPPEAISEVACYARDMGARLVVVHGETTAEPVEPGTNAAALASPFVDVLAHPGLLTEEEAGLAQQNGVFLEISGRKGHAGTNRHVVSVARKMGARLLLNSDAHDEDDLMSTERVQAILLGAGLTDEEILIVSQRNPDLLLEKVGMARS